MIYFTKAKTVTQPSGQQSEVKGLREKKKKHTLFICEAMLQSLIIHLRSTVIFLGPHQHESTIHRMTYSINQHEVVAKLVINSKAGRTSIHLYMQLYLSHIQGNGFFSLAIHINMDAIFYS